MKILYVLNGLGFATNISLGGSDKRAMEIGSRLLKKGHQISVLTTPIGKQLLEKQLPAEYCVIFEPGYLKGKIRNTFSGRLLAYFYTTAAGSFYPLKERFDIAYPTSDFFFDCIPANFLKIRKKTKRVASIVHHAILNPLQRKGELLKNLFLFISQRLSFLFMALFSESVFVYDTKEGQNVKTILNNFGINGKIIHSVICGVDLKKINAIPELEKKYLACFIGGLRPAKGLKDLVPIWAKVCKVFKEAKLLIIGSGLEENIEFLKNEIAKAGLNNNIALVNENIEEGMLYGSIARSKLLILPSYEEGWSIIICEALGLGVPAVVYNLAVFDIFKDTVLRSEIGNTDDFAQKIIDIESNMEFYKQLKNSALVLSKNFDWDKAAQDEEALLLGILNE